jgi:hypothetical protein
MVFLFLSVFQIHRDRYEARFTSHAIAKPASRQSQIDHSSLANVLTTTQLIPRALGTEGAVERLEQSGRVSYVNLSFCGCEFRPNFRWLENSDVWKSLSYLTLNCEHCTFEAPVRNC